MIIDATDLAILKILQQDPLIPATKIAEILNIKPATVRYRIKKMIDKGVIRRFLIDIDPKAIGYEITGYLLIRARPGKEFDIADELVKMNEVRGLIITIGDFSILTEIWCKDLDDYRKLMNKMNKNENVEEIVSLVQFKKVK